MRESRSAVGTATLASFLGGRDHTFFGVTISLFSAGIFYIGLLPLGCLLWGLVVGPSLTFVTFALSALVLVWFGASGLFAKALYAYVPLVGLTRYLFMGFYLLRVPLILAAAAAWDQFSTTTRRDRLTLFAIPVLAVLALDFALYGERVILDGADAQLFAQLWPPIYRRLAVYAGGVAAAWVVARVLSKSSGNAVAVALLAALFLDTFGYSYQSGSPANRYRLTFRSAPSANWSPFMDLMQPAYRAGRVQPLKWQPARLDAPRDPRAQAILSLSPAYFHTYAYAQFDPCRSSLVGFTVASSMAVLLDARDPNDPALRTVLGCDAPKLRLLTGAHYASSRADASAAVRSTSDFVHTAIIEATSRAPIVDERQFADTDLPGAVSVTAFSANRLIAHVRVITPDGAWLVYADAYDPRWHASVNDTPTVVVPADLGLKAIRVPPGDSTVRLEFYSMGTVALTVLALVGAACSLCLLVCCVRCAVCGFPQQPLALTEDD
jgi:hypothetical protein